MAKTTALKTPKTDPQPGQKNAPVKKKTSIEKPPGAKTPCSSRVLAPGEAGEIGARIRAVLLELMCESESDQVRVAAAKALMEKIRKTQASSEDAAQDDAAAAAADRDEAIRAARELVDALGVSAAALSGRPGRKGQVDPHRAG